MKHTVTFLLMSLVLLNPPTALAHSPHDIIQDIKLSPNYTHDKTIFTVVRQSLFISVDEGKKWLRLSKGLCPHGLTDLAISPAFDVDQTLFVSCSKGKIFRSKNKGQSWMEFSNGLPGSRIDFFAISPQFETNHTVLSVVGKSELYQTKNAGNEWKKVFHEESNITAIDWAGDMVAVGTGSGSLYISMDNGTTWNKHAQHPRNRRITCIELPRGLSLDEPFFIGTVKEGIFKVIDGGSSFQNVSNGIPDKNITSLDSLYEDGQLMLFASTWNDAVFRSKDSGATWSKHEQGLLKNIQANQYLSPHFFRIAVADDTTVFLGAFCGVFRSNDKGLSWQKLYSLSPHIIVGLDLSPPTTSGFSIGLTNYIAGISISDDGGNSWNTSTRGFPKAKTRLSELAYSPNYASDKTIFTSTFDYLLKSTDGGNQWRAISLQPPKMSIEGFKILYQKILTRGPFRNPQSDAILKLRSFLQSFFRSPYLPFVFPTWFLLSPEFSTDQTLFFGAAPSGLYKSRNGGNTFSLLWDSFKMPIESFVVSPGYPNDQTLFVCLASGLYRSLDGGKTWEQVGQEAGIVSSFLAISPNYIHDQTLFAGSSSGLFRTRDAGQTWQKMSITGNRNLKEPVGGLAISPFFASDRQLMVQVRGGDLFLCRDYDNNFKAVPCGILGSGFEFSPLRGFDRAKAEVLKFSPNYDKDHTIYGVSIDQLMKSMDRGRTWTLIARPIK